MARLFGTNYVNNCSYYCHQASGVGLGSAIGTGAGTVRLEDLEETDLYILIGANPASNHPRLMRSFMNIRRRGGKVIVINPFKETGLVNFRVPSDVRSLLFGSQIASLYVQPHIARGFGDAHGHCENHSGTKRPRRRVHRTATPKTSPRSPSRCSRRVGRTSSPKAAWSGKRSSTSRKQYLAAKNVVIGWCMGITHHLHGTQNVQMIANVALLRGMVGRRKAGVMPIRGHSNVQGMGSVGVTPALKKAILERFEEQLGISRAHFARLRHDGLHAGRPARGDGFRPLPRREFVRQQSRHRARPGSPQSAQDGGVSLHDFEHRPCLGHGAGDVDPAGLASR